MHCSWTTARAKQKTSNLCWANQTERKQTKPSQNCQTHQNFKLFNYGSFKKNSKTILIIYIKPLNMFGRHTSSFLQLNWE